MFPALCLLGSVSLSLLGCATKPPTIQPEDPLFGAWANKRHDTPGSLWFAKKVILADGREMDFKYSTDAEPASEGRNSFDKTWIDAKGNHWYHLRYTNETLRLERFVLSRVSAQGTILEQLNYRFDYPKELDTSDVQYVIYYKDQQE